MRRKISYHGLKKHLSEERLGKLNNAWQYLTPWQRTLIFAKVILHSAPDLHQHIEHIKYFYLRWLTYRIYPAHWLNFKKELRYIIYFASIISKVHLAIMFSQMALYFIYIKR